MDRNTLITQVKMNCDISDAQFWGYYSICGLFMRLRELFRSERALAPWETLPQQELSEWIGSRENQWEALGKEPLQGIELDGIVYDPLDVEGINTLLKPHHLLYGAGYGMFGKPTFFLASLESEEELHDYRVSHAGKELCRDISAPVAMLQGRCIVLRHEQVSALLWEKFLELKGRRFGGVLEEAFSAYGIRREERLSQDLNERMEALSDGITPLFLFHEVGEAYEDEHSDEWLAILSTTGDKWTELYLRGIKDLLADMSDMGPLKSIIDTENVPLLSFYVAFMTGIRKELYLDMAEAFRLFSDGGDWSLIEKARISAYRNAYNLKRSILSLGGDAQGIRKYLEKAKENGWQQEA